MKKFIYIFLLIAFFAGCENSTQNKVVETDTTPPAVVTNLTISYNYKLRQLTFTWVDPDDADFKNIILKYRFGEDGEEKTQSISRRFQKFELKDVEPGLWVYASAVSVDAVGNESESCEEVKYATTTTVIINSITLDKPHLLYTSKEKICATLEGENFNLLSDDAAKCLRIYLYDDTTYCFECVAKVDKINNKATAEFNLDQDDFDPAKANSELGFEYTIKYCFDGVPYDDVTAKLRLSALPSVSRVEIYEQGTKAVSVTSFDVDDVNSETKINAHIGGYNFDLASTLECAFYDSDGNKTSYSAVIDEEFSSDSGSQDFYVEVPVPQESSTYFLKILVDGNVLNTKYATLPVYGDVEFSQLKIPAAGSAPEEEYLYGMLKGVNFSKPSLDVDDFVVECSSDSTVVSAAEIKVLSDSFATVKLKIPSGTGKYTVTVKFDRAQVSGVLRVDDYSDYKTGDLYLQDMEPVSYSSSDLSYTDAQKDAAVGIIYFNAYGVPLLLGIKNFYEASGTKKNRSWAKSSTLGSSTNLVQLYATCKTEVKTVDGKTKTFIESYGDTDGSDNWDTIKVLVFQIGRASCRERV